MLFSCLAFNVKYIQTVLFYLFLFYFFVFQPAGELSLEKEVTSGWHATATTSAASPCMPATPSHRPEEAEMHLSSPNFKIDFISMMCFVITLKNLNRMYVFLLPPEFSLNCLNYN